MPEENAHLLFEPIPACCGENDGLCDGEYFVSRFTRKRVRGTLEGLEVGASGSGAGVGGVGSSTGGLRGRTVGLGPCRVAGGTAPTFTGGAVTGCMVKTAGAEEGRKYFKETFRRAEEEAKEGTVVWCDVEIQWR